MGGIPLRLLPVLFRFCEGGRKIRPESFVIPEGKRALTIREVINLDGGKQVLSLLKNKVVETTCMK